MAVRSLAQSSLRQNPQLNSMLAGYQPNAFHHLETVRLGATASEVQFTNLDRYRDYQHLQIRAVAKSGAAVGYNILEMAMRLNNATSTYRNHWMQGNGSSVTSSDFSRSFMLVGNTMSSDSGIGPTFIGAVIDILDPFDTLKNTTVRGISGGQDSRSTLGPNGIITLASGAYFSTDAISSITLYSAYGGSTLSSFTAGSRFSLYGIKAKA